MAAPTATVRQTPVGIKLDDGFSSKITLKRDPDVSFWEKTVKPPGLDGGDAIETTTMHNSRLRTMSPRQLRTMTDSTGTAAYDPAVLTQLLECINQNDEITHRFPDGTTWAYWGYLKSFEPSDLAEGSQPEAAFTIVATNQDNDGVERDPVVVGVAGT